MSTATEYATGLRDLADWIEAHPDESAEIYEADVRIMPTDTKANAARFARAMSPCDKDYSSDLFKLVRNFGPVKLRAIFWRTAVCERVVTATKEVTKLVPDPSVEVPMIEVTETQEIVEWVCAPILEEVSA